MADDYHFSSAHGLLLLQQRASNRLTQSIRSRLLRQRQAVGLAEMVIISHFRRLSPQKLCHQ